ncbi:uncharacterized protein MONOS_15631 [Monocercomonoides exilis]|uniref:uncharacterized protein n=1 Tax=Monocercomonoides exilis TaxID=2049356 RepID=UPI00355ACC51|nr:hypothetical protein MONOS_15631 [Monocercomonoides exilis]|eukprot:MONOS_15631.1-p1 / transcript=MONOS_15631.1 / gene=MONOS_15631 / organism=Monocercomonoides_exilis_PA203 / gene_product=unspecified product / transcript_product=unspecified product / location=Mono_scaffold01292:9019-10722(+) / protein_length=568 / sequence_SO=supercontig / SO=protein_coding / is_pseudo=false
METELFSGTFLEEIGRKQQQKIFGRMIQAEKMERTGKEIFVNIFFNKNLFGSSSRRGRKMDTAALGYFATLCQDAWGREGKGRTSVNEFNFSSFCQYFASPSISLVSLSKLSFFNISTANDVCSPSATTSTQTICLMSSCSFLSVCDAYDGGIVPSLNNPLASLSVSNTSFVGCCRTRNVECIGTSEVPLKPDRQNETFNGANSFTWCEWSGSKATGKGETYSDGTSNGGAIFMYGQSSATVSVSHCAFNECVAYYAGGGISCYSIKSVEIVNNTFNACASETWIGGGVFVFTISTCVRISGCEFQNCKANNGGGGLRLENFQVSGTGCIGNENGGGESACVFDCSFTSCSITNSYGGGMCCVTVPATQFKMRGIQFISCNALSHGGGFHLNPNRPTTSNDRIYCYFLFFHECKCSANPPRGYDIAYADYYKHFLDSGNPFNECYTTNADDRRLFFEHYNGSNWIGQHTEKKWWLKDKTIYVSVSGNDLYELCGANTTIPCKTVKKALEMCEVQVSLAITLLEGDHQSEATTVEIGEKKISVIGSGKDKSLIETGALFPSSVEEPFM